MDVKRTITAVVLAIGVLLLWNVMFPPAKRVTQQAPQQTGEQAAQDAGAQQPAATPPPSAPEVRAEGAFDPDLGETVTIKTPRYTAKINTAGGVLTQMTLNNYKEGIKKGAPEVNLIGERAADQAPMSLMVNGKPAWKDVRWTAKGQDRTLDKGQTASIVLTGYFDSAIIRRELTFSGDSFLVEEKVTVTNNGDAPYTADLGFFVTSTNLSPGENRYNRMEVAYLNRAGRDEEAGTDDLEAGLTAANGLKWAAIMDNYFMLALAPRSDDMAMSAVFADDVYKLVVGKKVTVGPGEEQAVSCDYYLGPKSEKTLDGAPNQLETSINYGFFNFLAKPLMKFLVILHSIMGNYGVAIIVLTIIIKIIFWPLSQKSYKSMDQMKKLQPLMAKIREKYKDDRQKMNQEVMSLYKTYKVNPLGGCLPMLLQIPVFIALYQGLLGSIELRHAAFISTLPFTDIVWLADLSAKDPLYISPIIMGATMLLQQKMTPSPGDPTQAKIMMFMPIVFTFIFLNFPAGLVVYWLCNNVLSIGQQWWMLRGSSSPAKAKKKS